MSSHFTEPNIPEAESDFQSPRQGAYAHPDFGAELGTYERETLTINDVLPGESHAADVNEKAIRTTHVKGERQNPIYTVDAPIDLMSTYQTPVGSVTPSKVVLPNQFRTQLIIQNLSTVASGTTVSVSGVSGAGAVNGLQIGPGQSLSLGYTGELWAIASAAATIAVAEFTRAQDS